MCWVKLFRSSHPSKRYVKVTQGHGVRVRRANAGVSTGDMCLGVVAGARLLGHGTAGLFYSLKPALKTGQEGPTECEVHVMKASPRYFGPQ